MRNSPLGTDAGEAAQQRSNLRGEESIGARSREIGVEPAAQLLERADLWRCGRAACDARNGEVVNPGVVRDPRPLPASQLQVGPQRIHHFVHVPILGTDALEVKAPVHTVCRDNHPMGKRPVREVLAANLEALMDHAELSQPGVVQAARRAGFTLDQTTVGRALNNSHTASIATVEALAAAFGREAWEMLTPNLDPRRQVRLASEGAVEAEVLKRLQSLLDEAARLQVSDEKARSGPSVADPYPHVKTPGGKPTASGDREDTSQARQTAAAVKSRRR